MASTSKHYEAGYLDGTPAVTTQPTVYHPHPHPHHHHPVPINYPVNVPPGLESLLYLDTILVNQKREWLEILCGCETNNRYKIRDVTGKELFMAKEDTPCCSRHFCGAARPFDIKIEDAQGTEIIHISRPFAFGCYMCNCSLHSVQIESPPGVVVGTVDQLGGCGGCTPKFVLRNQAGDVVLRVEGQDCGYCCHYCTVTFNLMSADGTVKVGQIQKRWSGLARELFTDADNFGISFPPDLDVKMKAVVLGTLFLIDFMFFEHKNN